MTPAIVLSPSLFWYYDITAHNIMFITRVRNNIMLPFPSAHAHHPTFKPGGPKLRSEGYNGPPCCPPPQHTPKRICPKRRHHQPALAPCSSRAWPGSSPEPYPDRRLPSLAEAKTSRKRNSLARRSKGGQQVAGNDTFFQICESDKSNPRMWIVYELPYSSYCLSRYSLSPWTPVASPTTPRVQRLSSLQKDRDQVAFKIFETNREIEKEIKPHENDPAQKGYLDSLEALKLQWEQRFDVLLDEIKSHPTVNYRTDFPSYSSRKFTFWYQHRRQRRHMVDTHGRYTW